MNGQMTTNGPPTTCSCGYLLDGGGFENKDARLELEMVPDIDHTRPLYHQIRELRMRLEYAEGRRDLMTGLLLEPVP